MTEEGLCFEEKVKLDGQVQSHARYLGPLIHAAGMAKYERANRTQLAKVAFSRLGRFWWSGSPMRLKRMVYLAYVQGTLLSVAEAMLITKVDYKKV